MAHAADGPTVESGHAARTDASGAGAAESEDRPPVESLLYRGESVVETLDVDDSQLIATSHRVVALDPAGEARVRTCDRLNAEDVRPDTIADDRFAAPTLKALVAGASLTGVGLLVPFERLLDPITGIRAPGFEAVVVLFSVLQRTLALLDDLLLVAGLLSLAVGLGGLAWYLSGRMPVVRVSVVGTGDIVVVGSVDDQRDLFAFRDVLRSPGEDAEGSEIRST